MKINELYDKRNKAITAARAFLDSKRGESDTLSAEDSATYDKVEADISALTAEIEREGKLSAIENELKKPTSAPIVDSPQKPEVPTKTGRASVEYKDALLKAMRSNFRQISNVLEVGTDETGGYLVPEEYDKRLIDTLSEECIMRKLGTTLKTSGAHKINIAGTKPAALWIAEGGALQFGDATFSQMTLDAHKLHVAVKVTEELLYDNAFNLESYILRQFGMALANAEEDAFLNGNGTTQPLGMLAATGGGEIGVTTAGAAAITSDEVLNLVYSLKRPYRKNASFASHWYESRDGGTGGFFANTASAAKNVIDTVHILLGVNKEWWHL